MSKCDRDYKDNVSWSALLIGDLSRKYSGLIIEHRKPQMSDSASEYLCFSNETVNFYWYIRYEPIELIYNLKNDYDDAFEQICYNLELAWDEHCRKLLYGEEVLTN